MRKPTAHGASPPSSSLAGLRQAAVDSFNAGRDGDAEQQANLLLTLHANDSAALNVLGAIALKRGVYADAIALFRQSLRSQPDNPFIHFNLAEARRRSCSHGLAVEHYDRAIQCKPDFAEAHAQKGESLRARGHVTEAASAYRKALDLKSGLASALNGLGRLLQATGAMDEAARHYECAVRARLEGDSASVAALFANVGLIRLERGAAIEGFSALTEAVRRNPESSELWRLLAQNLRHTKVAPDTGVFRDVLLSLLRREDVDPTALATAIVAVLRQDPAIADLLRRSALAVADGAVLDIRDPALGRLIQDPLFLGLLPAASVPDLEIELLLTDIRRTLVLAGAQANFDPCNTLGLEFVAALGQQCSLNEYVYFQGADEGRALESLCARISQTIPSTFDDWMALATIACCVPLRDLALAAEALAAAPAPMRPLVRQQIEEIAQEAAIATGLMIARTGAPAHAENRSAEGESAFPRWTRAFGGAPRTLRDVLKSAMPYLSAQELPQTSRPRVLILGCRTGGAIFAALRTYEGASIVAVDDNIRNLAYAKRKLLEGGYADVELLCARAFDEIGKEAEFDLIEMPFVLYKSENPEAALSQISKLLKHGGLLQFSLYSEKARRSVRRLHEIIPISMMNATIEELRSLRRDLMLNPVASEMDVIMSPASDFWASSPCRELLFRSNERRFALSEIGHMLQRLQLDFLGLELGHSIDWARFRTEHPGLDAHADLDAWLAFETNHPETFGGGYRIWARKRYARR